MKTAVPNFHRISLPPTEALQAATAAWRMGSFSAAADELGLTHGAVSRRVALVEAWAGFPLFSRHGRGVCHTADGERILLRIEAALIQLSDSARVTAMDTEPEPVRLSVIPSFARLWLLPNLKMLEGTPPDLRITVEIDSRFSVLSESRIAIRYGSGRWPGVTATSLFRERLVPVATQEIASKLRSLGAASSIRSQPLIHVNSDILWHTWHGYQNLAFEPRADDRSFDDYDLSLEAAAEGLGVALMRIPFGLDRANQLGLCPISDTAAESDLGFHVVTRLGKRTATVEKLVNRILAAGQITAQEGLKQFPKQGF